MTHFLEFNKTIFFCLDETAKTQSVISDEYEIVCNGKPVPANQRASTLPATTANTSNTKDFLRAKVPPPRPSDSQLTRLSKTEDNYGYVSVSKQNTSGAYSKTLPTSSSSSSLTKGTAIPPPKPSSNQLTRLSQTGDDYEYSPIFTGNSPVGTLPSSSPVTDKQNNNNNKMTIVPVSKDYGPEESINPKVYEELLVKPSQIKGHQYAQVMSSK